VTPVPGSLQGLQRSEHWYKPAIRAIIEGLTDAQGVPHLHIYLTLLRLYQQSHRFRHRFTGSRPNRNIRLMVDVLLTMNEAFRDAAGGVSCSPATSGARK